MILFKDLDPSLLEIVLNEDLKELETDITNTKYSYEGKMNRLRKLDMIILGSTGKRLNPASKEFFQNKLKSLKDQCRKLK